MRVSESPIFAFANKLANLIDEHYVVVEKELIIGVGTVMSKFTLGKSMIPLGAISLKFRGSERTVLMHTVDESPTSDFRLVFTTARPIVTHPKSLIISQDAANNELDELLSKVFDHLNGAPPALPDSPFGEPLIPNLEG